MWKRIFLLMLMWLKAVLVSAQFIAGVMNGTGAYMPAIAFIAGTSQQSANSNNATTGAINTTGATFITIGVASYGAVGVPAVSDSKGNTYTQVTTAVSSSFGRATIFRCYNPTVGASHTFTVSGSGSYPSIAAGSFSGVAISAALDQQNSNTTSGNTLTTGSVTPTVNNELVVTMLCHSTADACSINGGFTVTNSGIFVGGAAFGFGMAYLIQTTATAANPTWNYVNNSNAAAVINTYKQ
jgi:hypothetical protein